MVKTTIFLFLIFSEDEDADPSFAVYPLTIEDKNDQKCLFLALTELFPNTSVQ